MRVAELTPVDVQVVPAEERSNWGRKIARGEFVTSVEVLPPKGCDAQKTLDSIRLLKDAGVDGVNIPDGPRAQTRMSAQATAVLVEREIGIEAVLHYCCRDRNLLGMMSDLLGAAALGLHNLLIITGDPPKMGPYPDATAVFDIDAIGLTNMVNKLNHGVDIGNNPIGKPTAFSIGVGVNPGAVNLEEEIRRFEWKVEAGAEYAITQPVFDTGQLVTFLGQDLARQDPDRRRHLAVDLVPQRRVPAQRSPRRERHAGNPGANANRLGTRAKNTPAKKASPSRVNRLTEVRDVIAGVQVSAPFGNVKYALAGL